MKRINKIKGLLAMAAFTILSIAAIKGYLECVTY